MAIGSAQVGEWYRNICTQDLFFVTAFDQKSRSIEMQSLDGDVGEIDEEAWSSLPLALAEQPETYTDNDGSVDEGYPDDVHSPVWRATFGGAAVKPC